MAAAKNVLRRLAGNSQMAINDGIYDIDVSLQRSGRDFKEIIKTNLHATLLTEIKFSSPSLGKIRTVTNAASVAQQMVAGGAKAISVLTQPHLFNGSPQYLIDVRQATDVPILMKDIIVDKIQIDAAKKIGADYILLIQSLFEQKILKDIDEFIGYAHKQGVDVLVEVHTKKELQDIKDARADIIGINNRNLDTLEIDLKNTEDILKGYKKSTIVLSESGIQTPQDIRYLKKCGADAFLVGSSIMKSDNIGRHVRGLVEAF